MFNNQYKLIGQAPIEQKGFLVWFTGLSGSGKTTIANNLEKVLKNHNFITCRLDGDVLRQSLNKDLGFTKKDREENIRRVKEVSKILVDTNVITLASFISPYERDRQLVQEYMNGQFAEVYVNCPLLICEKRKSDIYMKARQGIIKEFTGISSPYEEPKNPDLIIKSDEENITQSVDRVIKYLIGKKVIF